MRRMYWLFATTAIVWAAAPAALADCPCELEGDLNGDCIVNLSDLAILLSNYGRSCESITVTYPDPETVWTHGQTGTYVEWSGSGGEQVYVEIYKGGDYAGEYHMWTANDGHVDRTEAIPSELEPGDDYRVKVIDDLGHYGWSEEFTILGPATITVTYPDADTVWTHGQTGTHVDWSGSNGEQVYVKLYLDGGAYVGEYHMWTANDGHVNRTEAIPAEWGSGTGFKIMVIDDLGEYGWSDAFEIQGS